MINFVVVSHNKKLAQEAINLAKSMQMFEFEILNAGGLQDSEEYGTDATIIMDKIQELAPKGDVIVFCELGSSLMNTQMAIEMLALDNVFLANGPLVEGLIVAVSSNNPNSSVSSILDEISLLRTFDKVI
ncbi:dihydroxyacetone kinase phosphoryl donor subunit DhaM [Mycoplasmopsis pullorum]|uniref:phosphoenolpyruvate--glycerone phosphotransferase n=1 Tax=Mycoplasmopsis pullorum TaxID=48003 RepID=A0A1L4FRA9_9BACT|nr:dihydroxyacetone kinase phosphoryl donor subunit DhaM [Mycoplasmopsis pullorum]APJ38147.1 hypothetical protein BLA55_00355 [Mycoplasmopsis pullorum]